MHHHQSRQPFVPAAVPSRQELFSRFGVSERITNDTVVYLCHQTIFKLVPEFDYVFRCGISTWSKAAC